MIKDIIEYKRKQLYETIGLAGLSSEETIAASRELEDFLTFHARMSSPVSLPKEVNANVHANAIENIFEIALKEKLELPFEINGKLLEYAEWFRIELVYSLLQSIQDKHGSEAVSYIGEFVPVRCIFPEQVQDFQSSLKHLNSIFHLNHKSPNYIGEYLPFMEIKNETALFCHTPHYSAAFNHGIIKGMANKFNTSLKLHMIDGATGGQFKIIG